MPFTMSIQVVSQLFCFRNLPNPAMIATTSNLMYWMRSYFPLRSSVVFPKPRVVLELKGGLGAIRQKSPLERFTHGFNSTQSMEGNHQRGAF
jgi:hypothetical protein